MSIFGLTLGLGFLVSSFYLWKLARRDGLNEEKMMDAMLLTAFGGALFGRVAYISLNFTQFGLDFGRWLLFVKYPGFSFYGVVFGVLFLLFLFSRKEKYEFWKLADLFAPPGTILTVFGYCGLGNYITAGQYVVVFAGLLFLHRQVVKVPEWGKVFNRPGYLALIYLLPITRLATAVVFLLRYGGIIKRMIKFPSQVLTQIKQYLEDRRRQTEHQLAELKKEDPFEDKSRLLDQAANDSEANQKAGHERAQVLINQVNSALVEIRKALTKIKIGNYGICENCKKMIDTDRLAAMPMATLCVDCAKKKVKK